MQRLQRDTLPLGGFAGLTETRMIKDAKIGGDNSTWNGIGNFVYLADARYLPHGETHMHSHLEIDVITIMLEGNLIHEGSLEDGQSMVANQVQVQRAGGESFSHNEINPDESGTRLLQLWVQPETAGEASGYKLYKPGHNTLQRIYGGTKAQTATFDSHTVIEVGILEQGCEITKPGPLLAYISSGEAELNGEKVKEGDLIRAENMALTVRSENLHITVISEE
ncbi:MAG: pirin family protein [Pseudomonadales bacterium]|nr:pirin family protein [Pseudomonadales bacterium]